MLSVHVSHKGSAFPIEDKGRVACSCYCRVVGRRLRSFTLETKCRQCVDCKDILKCKVHTVDWSLTLISHSLIFFLILPFIPISSPSSSPVPL